MTVHPSASHRSMIHSLDESLPIPRSVPRAVHEVFSAHADFVWRSLQRLGVRDADLEDALQEVFIVVHRQLGAFDGAAKMTTWLFSIALRIASTFRRRSHLHRELPECEGQELPDASDSPLEAYERAQARKRLDAILDELDEERRAVFVMFEIEGMTGEEIAHLIGVPLGTVHSRLHRARADVEVAVVRLRSRERRSP